MAQRSSSSGVESQDDPRRDTPPAPAPDPEALREQIVKLLGPLDLVVLSRDRVQAALDDAVQRGRLTRSDATDLVGDLVAVGRRQTEDLLASLDTLVSGSTDLLLREVERARRVAGLSPSFPIEGYDELTAAQVSPRLAELTPPELRTVREHERRNANRKTVLAAIEHRLR